MMDTLAALAAATLEHLAALDDRGATAISLALRLFPIVLLLELPMFTLVALGVLRWAARDERPAPPDRRFAPAVTVIVTCYSETETALRHNVLSLCEQIYPGEVEIIAVLDGAARQVAAHRALLRLQADVQRYPGRSLRVLPKWQRGGRVSSLNAGLMHARGEILIAADADTSFDNDMLRRLIPRFRDPDTVAVAGNLRVRNAGDSLIARLQAMEYLLSIETSRIGLAEWNMLNNISGAFGAFRTAVVRRIGGWDTHSAEDLDITLRLKSLLGRYPHLRLAFEPGAVGHTEVPATINGFLRQRLRWDGDLFFMYLRKHRPSLAGNAVGWRNLFGIIAYNLLFQIVVPFALLLYLVWAAAVLPAGQFLATLVLVYALYAAKTLFLYLAHLGLVSPKPRADLGFLPLLPLYPLFAFLQRLWSAVALLNEMLRRSHQESGMAPWWVLRRGRRF